MIYDPVKEVVEELAKENPVTIIDEDTAAEVYRRINEQMSRIAIEYNMKQAGSETEASRSYVTC